MYGERSGGDHCCNRAATMWLEDELMVAVHDRADGLPGVLSTDVIDQLPPLRARLIVGVCLRAGGRLEHGTAEQFEQACVAAARRDPGGSGWWRQALGMPAVDTPRRAGPRNDRRVPAGWKASFGGL